MKNICMILCLLLSVPLFSGCDQITAQAETIAQQIDVENIINDVIDSIDWEELQSYASQGYDALTEKFPAMKAENVKAFLKKNGLELLHDFVSSTDDSSQENARKLGEIIKILNPELSDEVDSVISG